MKSQREYIPESEIESIKLSVIGDDYNALLQVIFQLLVGHNNLHIRCRIRYSERDPWKRLIFAISE